MEFKNRWDSVNIKYQKPSSEDLQEMMQQIEFLVKSFCQTIDMDFERIKVNVQLLEDVVIRTDMRILYFSVFHKDMKPNEYKRIIGLTVFWILKRHPFWVDIVPEDDEEMLKIASHINEKISTYIAITLLREYNPNFFDSNSDLLEGYVTELEYSFAYRDLSKESLYLMFDPFYYQHYFDSSNKQGSELF